MRQFSLCSIATLAILGLATLPGSAVAQEMGEHKLLAPQDIEWGPAPPSLPAGAQVALLYGDPGKEGIFAFRARVPADYYIAPHTHPRPEIVTVISGTVRLGMGTAGDREAAQVLPAGSFFALVPDSAHYFFADEESVIQLNSSGPWGIDYVDPKDDPRTQ